MFVQKDRYSTNCKDISDKAQALFCQLNTSEPPQSFSHCMYVSIRGHAKKEIKEVAAYIKTKCDVEERIFFKDPPAGYIITTDLLDKWTSYAQRKKISITKIKGSRGFLVAGSPLSVSEAIHSIQESYKQISESEDYVWYDQLVLNSVYRPLCVSEKLAEMKKLAASKFMANLSFSLSGSQGSSESCSNEAFFRVSRDHVVAIQIETAKLTAEVSDAIVVPTERINKKDVYPIQLPCLQAECFQVGYTNSIHGYSNKKLHTIGTAELLVAENSYSTRILHILYPISHLNLPDLVEKSLAFASEKRIGSISFPDIGSEMVSSVIESLASICSPTIHTVRIAVANEKQAKTYIRALQSIASATPELDSVPSLEKLSRHVWSWRDDSGAAILYDPTSMDLLNQAYEKDPTGSCPLSIGYQCYEVDFHVMKQRNISSLHEREVKRSLPQANNSEPYAMWKYLDDTGKFASYLPGDSALIESMYQGKGGGIDYLLINSRMYMCDFETMTQVNVETGFSRDIKREVMKNDSDFRPGFLYRNETIINFKSPVNHFQNLRSYVHDDFEKHMFCEDISLPLESVPSCLEAIINKHPMVNCEVTMAGPTQERRTVLRVRGVQELVQRAQTELQKAILDNLAPVALSHVVTPTETRYPSTWEPMTTEDCKIVSVPFASHEYIDVMTRFEDTMPEYVIVDIQRVQNKWIWQRYAIAKHRIGGKNNGRINELELFHGSRTAPAKSICKSEEGFDMRFSREGLWGRANYFAQDASYSNDYAYNGKGIKEIMLAQVLTGDSYACNADRTLRMPPEKPSQDSDRSSQLIQRYDSVSGVTNNCKVFMTYCNENAYPAYIIRYTSDVSTAAKQRQHIQQTQAKSRSSVQQTSSSVTSSSISAQTTGASAKPATQGVAGRVHPSVSGLQQKPSVSVTTSTTSAQATSRGNSSVSGSRQSSSSTSTAATGLSTQPSTPRTSNQVPSSTSGLKQSSNSALSSGASVQPTAHTQAQHRSDPPGKVSSHPDPLNSHPQAQQWYARSTRVLPSRPAPPPPRPINPYSNVSMSAPSSHSRIAPSQQKQQDHNKCIIS